MQSHIIVTNDPNFYPPSISPLNLFQPHPDLLTIESDTPNIGIESIRSIISFLSTSPFKSSNKVVMIPQAHRLTLAAQNALLKTLEEPPIYAILILFISNSDQLIPTIVSRCQIHKHHTNINKQYNPQIEQLMQTIYKSNSGQRILEASSYSSKRDTAISTTIEIIEYFHAILHKEPNQNIVHNLKLSQQTLLYLHQNTNPQLAIENLFLKLIKLHTNN